MSKKGMTQKRQRRLTLVGITSVMTIWIAALALLFSQPGVQSNGKVMPTLASGLEGVAVLPDTGAPMSPTILPTSLPVELPPGSQADTALISNPSNLISDISPTQPALLNIPDEPVPNSLVIRFEPELSQAERLAYITSLGGQIVQEIKPLNTVIISLPANQSANIQSMSITAGVVENEPDFYAGALYSPNDSLAAGQWGLDVVKAPQAWDLLPVSTPSVTVAVIDSGICASHADLQGRIVSDGWDFIDNDSTPQDEYGHGCAVAGIIAANSNNGLGIAGVAPNANVLPLRVLDAAGIGRYSNVAAAIVYAVDNGAEAINLSLGGPNPSSVLQDAVNYAEANGVTVIAAAGNNGLEQVFYPAAYPAVVAVGSVSQDLQRSPFSNYGDGIDLYAPGDGITTTSLDGSFQNFSGTSVAAPYVTGVWALRQAMGKNLVQDGGIVSALYASDAPVPTEEPPTELCLLSDTEAAESAYFDLVQQNAAQPGSVSTAQIEAARTAYLGLAEQCANALYDNNMTIDGGGISPFSGEIAPLFQIFGTKWQQEAAGAPQIGAAFNQGQPPAVPGGVINYSFMPTNVSLASKEVENGGGSTALVTAIGDLPNNAQCDLQGRIRQAFDAWESVANVDFVEMTETGLVPFGESGAVGDMRIGAQIIDGMTGELGHAYFPPPDPEIVTSTRSGDIFLDRSEVWGCAPSPEGVTPRVIDIGLVMLHELGHALGMQHERAAGVLALMNPTYNTALLTDAAGGNTLSLTAALKSDDQGGARAIYGGIGISAPALQPVPGTDTDNTPTFPWRDTVPGGSDYFEVEIYLSNGGLPGDVIFDSTTSGGNNPADPPAKSFTVPNTLQSLSYLWRVRAFDEGAFGVWSDFAPFSITIGIPAPLSPTAGQVLNSGDVRFLWGQVGSTNTYLLQIATQAEFTPESLIVDEIVAGTAFTAPTLTDGTYYWRLQTDNNPFSIVSSFRVDSAALVVDLSPGAPNALPADGTAFTGAGANENITLQWDALDGVSEYQLQLDTSENFVGLLFLDKLFLDKLFLDKLFLDKLFLDKLFLDKLFLDKLFLDKLFLDKLFLDKLFLDKLFLDKLFLDKLFLDKLFLDKLFLDKIEYTGGATASFTFDTLPLSEGVHYWRVRPRLPDGSFGPWSESRSFDVRTQDTKVVINEIKLSDPSWIEFHNTGTEVADMGDWQFFAYGPSGETQLLYTFPAGFTMQPGAYSVLYEGVGTDTDRALYTGGNQINWPLTAQGDEATGAALNSFGTVVTVPGLTSTNTTLTQVESASLAVEPTADQPVISIGPNGELLSNGLPLLPNSIQADATSTVEPNVTTQATPPANAQADDDIVTALTNFNIAIGDTVSNGVPGAGAGNIEFPESNDNYTFSATAGQVVLFDSLGSSTGAIRWQLRDPSSEVIFDHSTSADGGLHTLAEAGSYIIRVYSNSVATGTYSFRTIAEAPQTGPIFTVNTTAASDDGVCSVNDCSLIEAINASNGQAGANTIELATDAVYTLAAVNNNVNGANGLPAITTDITINGNGATITRSGDGGTPQFRFFHISNGNSLALNALSLTAGDAGGADGGAIFTSGSLTLTNVTLANNSANQGGSLLIASGGSAAISDSHLTDNTSTFLGGGFYVQSGGSAVVANTLIDINQGGSYGGGLYADGALTISDSTIADNTAGGGAGIRACCNGIINITNTTIANNIASSYAGGIMTIGVQLNLVNSTISGNVVLAPAGESFNGRGGGILNRLGGTVNLSNSTIVGNNAEQGGGLANESTITSKNSLIAAQANGGNCFGTAITTQGVNFVTDATCGSASSTLNVVSDTALNLGTLADNGGLTQTVALGAGSVAIDAVTDCTAVGGVTVTADQRGISRPQGAQCDSGAYEASAADTAQDGPTFTVNTTNATDDGVCGTLNCSLIEAINAANAQAGANTINMPAGFYDLALNNTTDGPNGLPSITSQMTINANNATIQRGAGAVSMRIFHVAASGNLTLNDADIGVGIAEASGSDFGGGLLNLSGGIVTVNNVLFRSNVAGSGGAIHNSGALTVNNSFFNVNGSSVGGAIANFGTLTITGTSFNNNEATSEGGGLWSNGTVNVTNTTFLDNTAGIGGAAANFGTMTVNTSTFTSNETTVNQGGAIANFNTITVDQSTFNNNLAALNGGAFDNAAFGTATASATITNSTLNNNTAGGVGGALLNYADSASSTAILTVRNSTISGNKSTVGFGGGIANFGGGGTETVNVEFSTLVSNEAISSANLRNMPDKTVNVKNSITALPVNGANCGGFITSAGGNFMDDISCNGFTQVSSAALNLGTLANNGGPTQTIALGTGSAAINAVTDCTLLDDTTLVTTDQRGNARPELLGGNCDAGAYEAAILPTPTPTYTPTSTPTDTPTPTPTLPPGDPAQPGPDFVVNNATDIADGVCGIANCSLREAVIASNADPNPSVITFDFAPGSVTVTLAGTELPTIVTDVTITSTPGRFNLSGNGQSRIFNVAPTGTLTTNWLILINGSAVNGSAILNDGTLNLITSTFFGNVASDSGTIMNTGIATVQGSNIFSNLVLNDGGAIDNQGVMTIEYSSMFNNSTSSGLPGSLGGAIFNSGTLTIDGSTFTNNSTTNGSGGAIANQGGLTITTSTFSDNNRAALGGAIHTTGLAMMTLTNVTVSGNSATTGGGIYIASPTTINFSTIANNTGGGIFSTGTPYGIKNSIVADQQTGANCAGTAPDTDGVNFADDASCGGGFTNTSTPLIEGLAFNIGRVYTHALTETSPARDAAIDCTTASGIVVATDARDIARPQGTECDAGAYEFGGDLHVTTTQMIQDGTDGNCSLPEAIIAANTGVASGSGNGECVPPNSSPKIITMGLNQIYRLTQVHNTTQGPNGLPPITFNNLYLHMNGSTITRTSDAPDFRIFYIAPGGQLYFNSAGTVSGGHLSGTDRGAGILNQGSLLSGGMTFENNIAAGDGGVIYNDVGATSNLFNNTFRNNQAGQGGVIFNAGTVINNSNNRNRFEDNRATSSGGVVYNTGGSVNLGYGIFLNNHADGAGGSVYNNAGDFTALNATFSGNQAAQGGALFHNNGTTDLNFNTIAENITTELGSGALHYVDGTMNIINSIVANNSGGNCSGSPFSTVGGSLEYPNAACGVGFTAANPLLAAKVDDTVLVYYPLLTGSPAIDALSTFGCPNSDGRYFARPVGTGCDIGSFEGVGIALTGDLTVTTTNPAANPIDGLCSLVEAIDAANSGNASGGMSGECVPTGGADTITLGTGLTYTLGVVNNTHINGSDNGLPAITSDITINANGSTITRSSEANFRIFYVALAGDLTLNNATLSNGFGDPGGAILSEGDLTLNYVSIADNFGSSGGGLFLTGTSIINNSSVTGNNALSPDGAGVFINGAGTLTMTNSTVANNTAAGIGGGITTGSGSSVVVNIINSTIANNTALDGAGIGVYGGSVTVFNTIIANNNGGNCSGNVSNGSGFTSSIQWPGFTCNDAISGADPVLGPLTGSPAYLPLSTDSAAIDAADPAFCPAIDQRGIPRDAATCDIGAVELTEAPALVPGTTGGAAALVSPLTTDFVRFGDTTIGPADASEWTGDNVAVTDSTDNNVTIGRDPSSSDTNHVTDWATQRPTEGGQNFTNVLINEIYTGSNDYVELYNPRAETADISNWELKLYDSNDELIAAPGATYTVRFAAGTLLRPGQFLIVGEQNPGSGIDFIAVPSIDWDDANASGAVTLTNGLTPIDFVRFGSSQANQLLVEPPGGTTFTGVVQSPLPFESIGRSSTSEDSNTEADWHSQVRTVGLVNVAIAPPANDNFTGATTIDALPFRDTGDTTNASAVNDPVLSCGASVGHTIWYKYTPTASQTIRLQTDGSDFDTVLAVFTLLNPTTPQQIAGLCSQRNDETNPQPGSRLSVPVTGGTTYYILIGGNLNVSGQYIFSVNAPVNDDVNNASLIGSLPFRTFNPNTGVANTNTTAATILDGEPVPTCAPSAGRSVWYRYEATDATKLRLRTAGTLFDTVITVYTGTPDNLVEVVCNNDDASDATSDLGFTPVPGTTYYFQVAGNNDQGGDLLFEVDVFPTPDNDLIGAAFTVTSDGDGTFSVTTPDGITPAPFDEDTTGATSTDDPVSAEQCTLNPGATVWFSYTAATTDTVVFQTFGSKYDTVLSIWTGDLLTPASLTQLGCNDDVSVNKDSRLTLGDISNGVVADVQVTAGTTYYIGVSGYFGETGDLVFNAFTPQTAAPVNDRVTTPYEITFNPDDGSYSVIGQPADETTPFVQDTTGAFPELVIEGAAPDGEDDITVPTPTCGDDVGYTVWYRYVAPERQQIVFDAAGSDFDTVITAYVLQGNNLVEVGCNDDFEGRAPSKLTLNTDEGVTLYLLFGGFKKDRGNLGIVISQSIAVTSFTLVDAANGSAEVDPLVDGAVIAASELPDTISIRANTDPEEVGSVKLELTSEGVPVLTTTDNEAPYALNGNNPDDSYIPWRYVPGIYTLKATPYAGNNGLGKAGTALTITFEISDNQAPQIAADEDTITVNEGLEAFNTGTFSDPDADPVALSASFGTVIDQGDGTWQWSYLTTDGPAESQTITITADDGLAGGEETVDFALVVTNVAPTATLSHTMESATTARLTFSNQNDASSIDLATGFTYSYDCTNDGTFETTGTNITAATFDCVYTLSGNYQARGRITDKDGGFTDSTIELTITIGNQPPVADAGDDQTVIATRPTLKASVALDGSGSDDPDGDIESYIWTEAGEQIASGVTPTVDLAIGTHIITLTVTDDEDSQATDTVTITVEAPANSAPVADAGENQTVTDVNKNGSELVTLDGTGSTDADGNSTIVSYAWTENGAPLATGATAQVTLPTGSHTIVLTVTDDLGLQDTDDVVIEIVAPAVVAPTANAGPDQVVNDNDRSGAELVTLNGSGSTDDGIITSYIWTENGVEIATGATPQVSLTVGTHTILLTVTDDDLATGTDTVVVKVNAPPTASAGNDQSVSAGTNNVSLDGSGSTDSDGTIVAYAWTEGAVTLSTQIAPTITLPLGDHTITLTVTDNNGATGTDTVFIRVNAANVPPTANAGPDQTVTDNDNNGSEIVTLNGSGSTDDLGITSYVWTENGVQIATGVTPQVTLNVGTHTITLTVTDGSNATGTDTVVITVLPKNTGPITVDDQVELSSDDVNEDGNSYDARNAQLWFGSGQSVTKSFMGLRFNNLEIPQGAVITEAHIEVYTATAQWINMRILVAGEAVNDSATFTSATRPSTRAFTSARLDYQSNTPWPAATWNNIGDVKAVVQEIVNRPGWLAGNSMSILIKGLGSQWGRKFVTSYDGNPAFAPRLVVTYAGGPPPSNNPPDVNVNAPSVTANEGVLANISGTVVDLDNNPVTLTASLGNVVKNGNTWTWSYTPADGPLNQAVTIYAVDNRGGSDSVTFNLIVNNVAPTASFSATPLSTYPNNPVTVTFSSPFDVAADLTGLTYTIDCGNGSVQTSAAASATCIYGAEGTFTVLGRITDKDGGYSDYQAVITVSSTPAGPVTITPQVNGSSDDVNENGATFQTNTPTVWVGTDGNAGQSYTGLRFNGLGIPAGATITEAYLEFYVTNSQWIGVDVLIAGEAADNSATFSNGSRPSGRLVTTNRVEHHSNVNWAANSWNPLTGNLSGVVQEIVSRPGWQSGNSLSLILKGMGSRFGRKFVTSYDGNPAFAPRLVIKYTVPSAPAPDIVVPPPAPIILPPPPTAAFTSDVSSGVAPLAVTFSNQSTGGIASYSWDFGDGTSSTDTNPMHIYNGVGAFTVTLTVNGLDGTIVTAQAVINVAAPPPAIQIMPPPPPIEEATPTPTEEVSAATTEPPAETTAAP